MARTQSGRPAAPRLAGRVVQPNVPARSTKVSEKLVLLPETAQNEAEIEEKKDFDDDNEAAPERDDEEQVRKRGHRRGKSYAERLPKSRRAEKLPRVTAYCTALSYRLKATAAFLRTQHGARTKLYDDCLYVVYHLPLLPGTNGYRIRSSPIVRNPGGNTLLDEAIERSEQRYYGEGFFEDAERFSVRGEEDDFLHQQQKPPNEVAADPPTNNVRRDSSQSTGGSISPSARQSSHHDPFSYAELYIFTYGIAVFWNFSATQEKDVLADLTFHNTSTAPTLSPLALASKFSPTSPINAPLTPTSPLMTLSSPHENPSDFETEEFHFSYDASISRPRVFNDMITLRSGDHMIKLTISHAIAQSTKLSSFEQQVATQMASTSHIPRRLALTGRLGLGRLEVVRMLGAMYKIRVDVNLSSNVLDTPNFFWETEPTLHPLYAAVREYLEIGPRIKVLNERCKVFLDLAEILSDGIADTKMSRLTLVVIGLIGISILVTVTEVFLRFGMLHKKVIGGNEGTDVVMGEIVNGSCYCGGPTLATGLKESKVDRIWMELGSPEL